MNRSTKTASIICSILVFFSIKAFSLGMGGQIGGIPSVDINQDTIAVENFDANFLYTVHFFRIPAVLGLGFEIGKDDGEFVIGPSCFFDYWVIDYQIKNTWNLYSGAGVAAKYMFDLNKNGLLSVGPRFFVGMNWLFLDNYIEYYAQLNLVPSYNYPIPQNDLANKKSFFRLGVPIETGVRVHF